MSLTNDQITAKNFKEFYEAIRPYLNGSFPTPIANKFDKANMYSTDEQIVGRWIDGKPLYQKTMDFGAIPSGVLNERVYTSAEEYYEHAHVINTFAVSNDTSVMQLPIVNANGPTASFGYNIRIDNSTHKLMLDLYTAIDRSGFGHFWATIQYTKTTDTAMEIGSDTDYSTTEKIVGTWIDGKPIYQKTLDIGTLSGNDVQFSLSSVYGLTDIEHAWKVSGYLVNRGGWEYDNFYLSANDNANITVFNTSIRVVCSGYANVTGGKVTIQYIKTTD